MTPKDTVIARSGRLGPDQPTEFHFLGFKPEDVEGFRRAIEDIELVPERLASTALSNVTISPLRPRGDGGFGGAVFSADRTVCEETVHRQKDYGIVMGFAEEPFPAGKPRKTLKAAIYGGVLFAGYGHIILESLSRLGPEAAASKLPILFHVHPTRWDSVPVVRSILQTLGWDARRVQVIDGILRVKTLHVRAPGVVLGESINLPHVEFLHDAIRARGNAAAPAAEESVLLSRTGLTGPQRRAFGEVFIEEKVGGFASVVHPQTLSFADQVIQMNAASRFFGFIGSQFHNLLFRTRQDPLDVVYFSSARINPAFFQIDLLFGGRRFYVNATRYGEVFEFGKISPFLVNFDAVAEGLSAAGFAPLGFALAPSPAELESFEHAFYRSWFELLLYGKFIGPSHYWDPATRADKLANLIARFQKRVARVRGNPVLASLAREVFTATFQKYRREVDEPMARALLEGILG